MRRTSPCCIVVALLLLAAPAWATQSVDDAIAKLVAAVEQGAPEELQTLAVWQWGDEKLTDPLRRAFRDDLEIALIQSQRFQYFHRERFRQILRERQLTLARLLDPSAMKAAAAAGINGFLSVEIIDAACAHPELEDFDTHCVILAKLTDAATATVVWAGYIEGTNPTVLRSLLGKTQPRSGQTRYRQIAQAIAASLKASGLAEAETPVKTLTLSHPPKDAEPDVGIGIRNPEDAPFGLEAFQDELLLAVVGTQTYAYVDPTHIARLVAHWQADSEAVAEQNKQTLAQSFALDGYLFGGIRSADEGALELSMRLVSLKDGSEAWAGKFRGVDSLLHIEPRQVPQPPVPRELPPEPEELTLEDIERPLKAPVPMPELLPVPQGPDAPKRINPLYVLLYIPIGLPRDALDATFLVADRVPLAGAATSGAYRYGGLAHLCRWGTPELKPVVSGECLSHGLLSDGGECMLFPNARTWAFAAHEDAEAIRAFAEEYQRVTEGNETRLAEWREAEQARKDDNADALKTLRERNAAQRRSWEQAVARVRRDNQIAEQRYQRDKQAADDHNQRAARVNLITRHVFDLEAAFAPRKPRPIPRPKPKPKPAPPKPPEPKPEPKPAPPEPKPAPPEPGPEPKPAPPKPAPPEPQPKPAPPKPPEPEKAKPYMGFDGQTITEEVAKELKLKATKGVVVTTVREGAPAAIAGLQKGDVINTFHGIPITTKTELIAAVAKMKPGDTLTLSGIRGDGKFEIKLTLGRR